MPVAVAVLKLLFASSFFSSGFFASGNRLNARVESKEKPAKLEEVQATLGTNPVMAQTQNVGDSSSGPHLGGTSPAMASADMAGVTEDALGKERLYERLWEPEDTTNTVSSEDASAEAPGFMAQTRPKDAVDGVLRGLKTAGGGLAGGLSMAVVAPVVGAKEGGVLGFAKGLGVGMIGGAALAVGGTAAGVAQVLRGIYMAPFAHYARREEKVWDQETGSWVDVDLRAEEKRLEAENSDEEDRPTGSEGREVKEMEYYDLLNVEPEASQSEIKKAYFKTARACHPDKNMGDEEATQKFQKLSEVYRVLSDPDERKKYDRDGKDGLQEQHMKMDPTLFFSLLFGSEHFVPWTGELHIAMQAADFTKAMEKGDAEEEEPHLSVPHSVSMKKRQRRRQVRCAVHLRDKLEGLVYGRDEEGWNKQMRMEAHQLATDSGQFGPALLSTLGEMYQVRSEIYLANQLAGWLSLSKFKASMKQNFMKMQQMVSFYQNAVGSALRVKKMYNAAKAVDREIKKGKIEGKDVDEAVQAKKVEAVFDDALPTFMKTAFAYVVRDIDETVKMVARKFLQDKSVPWQIRIRRGQALERLGRIFTEEGQKAAAEIAASGETKEFMQESAKAALQEAVMGSMQQK